MGNKITSQEKEQNKSPNKNLQDQPIVKEKSDDLKRESDTEVNKEFPYDSTGEPCDKEKSVINLLKAGEENNPNSENEDSTEAVGKNAPLATAEKNLQETEHLLDQESQERQAVPTNLNELREEYNTMTAKYTAQEKANTRTIKILQQDVQKLSSIINQMQEQLVAEREKSSQADKECQKKFAEYVKNAEEEKAKLLQKISKLETKSRSGISKTEYDENKKSKDNFQKVNKLLQEQLTELVSKDKKQQAQLSDLKNQIENMSAQNKTLMDENNSMKNVVETANLAKKTADDKLIMKKVASFQDPVLSHLQKDDNLEASVTEMLKAKDIQIEKITYERDRLMSEKEEMQSSFQQVLNMTMEEAEISSSYLEQKFKEINSHYMNLKEELKQKDKILELQKECNSLMIKKLHEDICLQTTRLMSLAEIAQVAQKAEKEIIQSIKIQLEKCKNMEELKLQLENELSEKFSSQVIRLSSLIQISEDSLEVEKGYIKKLTAELKDTTVSVRDNVSSVIKAVPTIVDENNRRHKKRKFLDIDDEEAEAREKCIAPNTDHQKKCTLCSEIERRCTVNPISVELSYWQAISGKQLTVVLDTNVIIDFIDIVSELLSCKIDGLYPIIYVPYIVVKELDGIRKDRKKRNLPLSKKCSESAVLLETMIKQSSRIRVQSLDEMKKCWIIDFKMKDNDDIITECCVGLKKSQHNIVLWTEDRNLRIKIMGHHIPTMRKLEVNDMIENGTKNPLQKTMLQDETIIIVVDMMSHVPSEIISQMLNDPKNALIILTQKSGVPPSVNEAQERESEEDKLTSAPSLGDLNLEQLFENLE